MKLWGGRFAKSTEFMVDDFNSSIRFDKRMYKEDIEGSIAHVTMLGKQNIITLDESAAIIKGLEALEIDIEANNIEFDISAEDIHMNIEALLTKRIGSVAKKMHTGRSRNDQVALDIRLYIKKEIKVIDSHLYELLKVLHQLSSDHISTIMPGYTHLQKAQPTTFSHHLMAYFEMFKRDRDRLKSTYNRMNQSPLGSGAFATTTYNLDRQFTADLLGFDSICLNSMDGVSDRDFLIDLLQNIAEVVSLMQQMQLTIL